MNKKSKNGAVDNQMRASREFHKGWKFGLQM
jgi:hypothetical protein